MQHVSPQLEFPGAQDVFNLSGAVCPPDPIKTAVAPASAPLDPDTRDMFARMEALYHYRKGRGKFITSSQPREEL